jgi:NADH:ubiquinone oxidoreductase subunit F (NADH-binding)/NADH:ubiquinone oxidoreductase subunit E
VSLILELSDLQERHGHLRDDDLKELARRRRVPLHRIQEVVSFYPHFRTEPLPPTTVALCRDLSCHLNGGAEFGQAVRAALAADPDVHVEEVSCLGRCDAAPAALVDGEPVADPRTERVVEIVRGAGKETPAVAPTSRRWRIDPYHASTDGHGHYSVYRSISQDDDAANTIISRLKAAGLRGMGGAGFPTGKKWELVRGEAAEPKYVICNADESEPGTFKDRVILAELPHLVIEGMRMAALTVGASEGWVYLRHEYEPERRILQAAIERAREAGVLGDGFDIEIFVSPGGYILGEETALLEAMEDRRGEPRNKPPYPGQRGLHSRPTLINNVETLAMVPSIVKHGPDWWKSLGARGHHGLKVISVSGHVERPGVYEIPMGTTVAELVDLAGGVSGGRRLEGFTPGGASSEFLPADRADVEIDFDSIKAAGSMLGAGALVVVAEGTDMLAAAANVTRFFRDESCGKCVPCRVGTEKMTAILEDILAGRDDGHLRELLPRLRETLAQTSICGLGQVALNPLASVLQHWPQSLDARAAGVEDRSGTA